MADLCLNRHSILFSFMFQAGNLSGQTSHMLALKSMRSITREILFFNMFVLFAVTGIAPACSETLKEAVDEAINSHPKLLSARAGVNRAGEEINEEFSGFFPELSVTGQGGRIFGDNSTSRGSSTTRGSTYSYLFEGSVRAKQMIFDGFEAVNRVDAATAKQKSAQFELLDVSESLALSAAQAYIDVLRSREGREMLRLHEIKIYDFLERVSTMVEQGAADEAELQQAREIKVILEGLIFDYDGQIKIAEANYYEIMGRAPSGELFDPVPRIDLFPNGVDDGVAQALSSHPALRSAAHDARALTFEVDAERAAFFPNVDGELSYLKKDQDEEIGGELVDARAVFRLNWEYETGGGQMARIRQKRYKHKEAMAKLHELERGVERTVRKAFAEYETSIAQLGNQNRRFLLNKDLLETHEAQFEGAVVSLLQLMRSENKVFSARLELMNGKYRLLASQFGVLASLGKMKESLDLTLVQRDQ